MRYITPTIQINNINAQPVLAGSEKIGFTDTKGDNQTEVLSKGSIFDDEYLDDDDE